MGIRLVLLGGVNRVISIHGMWVWLGRYVDRVSDLLRQKLKQADLLVLKKELMVQKREEALAEQGALEPRLDLLVQKTKELQKLVRSGKGLLCRARALPVTWDSEPALTHPVASLHRTRGGGGVGLETSSETQDLHLTVCCTCC